MRKYPETLLRPEQINEHNQVTDDEVLHDARRKLGIGNILYSAEENGMGAITTLIVRSLGGDSFHLGVMGASVGINNIFQWSGTLLLKKFNSNRVAMNAALVGGAIVALLIALTTSMSALIPAFKPVGLWSYVLLTVVFVAVSGTLANIESAWIGDLVPQNKRGWFTSYKWIICTIFSLVFTYLFSRLCDIFPGPVTYTGFYLLFMVSFLVVIPLFKTMVDRIPKNANFISAGASHHDRLNYKSAALWGYVIYNSIWAGGRGLLFAFSTAYMLDQFHCTITTLFYINLGQPIATIVMLLYLGKLTDRKGNRIPLLVVSTILGFSMFLWISSAWFGFLPIIIYAFFSSLGGYVGNMLQTNYALEIFPDKGRSGYIAIIRLITGIVTISCVIITGLIMRHIEGWHMTLWGATLNHYHLVFTVGTLITLSSMIPLAMIGKRTVSES